MRKPTTVVALILAMVSLLAVGCPGPQSAPPVPGAHAVVVVRAKEPVRVHGSKTGLGFRLSDGDDGGGERAPSPPTRTLSVPEANALLARLPALPKDADDAKDFALRAKSIPVPRPGETIHETFPPATADGAPRAPLVGLAGALRVTRHEPEGNVKLAPYATVTFSAPMVPITSHDDLSKIPIPARITPEPPGNWRWVGAETAMFQPTGRFPMATNYAIDVAAGTRGVNGNMLAEAFHSTFSTPALTLLEHGVTGDRADGAPLDPTVYSFFDQSVDADALLRVMVVTQNNELVKVRLATQSEIDSDEALGRLLEQHDQREGSSGLVAKARLVVWKPLEPLHRDAMIKVAFPAGSPSAEGPAKTLAEQSFSFHTYGPMQVTDHACDDCNPFSSFEVRFSNSLEPRKSDASAITVTPAIPDMKIDFGDSGVTISGNKKGRTKYTVKIAKVLTDVFGQTLAADDVHVFEVGPAHSHLFTTDARMTVLDPGLPGTALTVFSINDPTLRVRLYRVKVDEYEEYEDWIRDGDGQEKPKSPPGTLVVDALVHPAHRPDEVVATRVDLAPALKNGLGHVIAIIETTRPFKDRWQKEWTRQWIQVTHLGLQVVGDATDLVAWTTNLATAAPLAGIDVTCGARSAMSAVDGVARLLNTPQSRVIARRGNDSTFLASGIGQAAHSSDHTRVFTFDDRKIYKPGEQAHIKGWVRDVSYDKGGDVSLVPGSQGFTLRWNALDARSAELGKGEATVDDVGGFDFAVMVPKNANLGSAIVNLDLGGQRRGRHTFQIEEFRRPEFEVSATGGDGPYFVGEHATATIVAKYYAGGGLPNADVAWTVERSTGSFTPPNREEYAFGQNEERPWQALLRGKKRPLTTASWKGHTDARGAHHLRLDFDTLDPAYPMSVSLRGAVTDVNRQSWESRTTMLVHPASVYVGLKVARPFVTAGDPIGVDTLVVDTDGKPVAGRAVTVTATRLEWQRTLSGEAETEVDAVTCALTSRDVAGPCFLATKKGGEYRLTGVVVDEYGRKSQTAMRVWVLDAGALVDGGNGQNDLRLVSDKTTYRGGETAELLLVAPFAPAEGMLVVERGGVLSAERFTMTSSMQTLHVKLDGALTPNVRARVLLAGARVRTDARGRDDKKLPKRAAFASGEVNLSIPPLDRKLDVTVVPRERAIEPGGATTVDVQVKDARGAAVAGAEVAIVVVDESILALSRYSLPDPLARFYPDRSSDAIDETNRTLLGSELVPADLLAQADSIQMQMLAAFGGGSGLATLNGAMPLPPPSMPSAAYHAKAAPTSPRAPTSTAPISVRADFSALAVFEPARRTDASGHLEVPVKLPDSLTRYRVMAIAAAHENQFGSQESTITARLPLMVRPSPPRFLNFGDVFELPVVVQNQTDRPIDVALAVRSGNAKLMGPAGKRVEVPAHDRVEVRFAAAADRPGKALFQIGAEGGTFADASLVELPVWTPATTEAFATYGVLDTGAIRQPVAMPSGVFRQFGGLEVTTSSTAMQGLTDAVVYLAHYPFECNEQLASRILAIASLRDVLSAFDSKELPPPTALETTVTADLERLKTRQKWDGGWAFWWGEEWPFVSIHVAHALARAEAKGYALDAKMRERSLAWLQQVETHIPGWYSNEARRGLVAYALYVRRLLGNPDAERARRLIQEYGGLEKMNLEPIGWIWPTIHDSAASTNENQGIRRLVGNRVTETAGAAHFTTSYGDGDYLLLHSDRRADGLLLEAMIHDQPDSDLIPKLVKGLLAHRTAGRWGSTQENAFVLLALDAYFAKYESVTPDFVAKVWLGEGFAGEHAFHGRTTDSSEVDVPMAFLAKTGSGDLTLAKDGPGRLYYRVGMSYAPTDLNPPAIDRGFSVTRTYESVEDDADVRKDTSGVWHFKAGKMVRTRVTMVAPARRYHVALVDPIPAGVEPMNPALAVTGTIPASPKAQESANQYWYWQSTWYEHQNMRDDRVEAFASLLWEGVHEYVYTVRATTPGTFVVPPPKAEEMYSPEVFGRGAGDRVVVE